MHILFTLEHRKHIKCKLREHDWNMTKKSINVYASVTKALVHSRKVHVLTDLCLQSRPFAKCKILARHEMKNLYKKTQD